MDLDLAIAQDRHDPWSMGIPGMIDPAPRARSPLDDARGTAWEQSGHAPQPIGWTNDGRPVFAAGTVAMRRDLTGWSA
jgi:hypothetical protein